MLNNIELITSIKRPGDLSVKLFLNLEDLSTLTITASFLGGIRIIFNSTIRVKGHLLLI